MAEYLVNGYAYPSISEETLAWWLPRLTWLSAFSYGFTAEGRLVNLEDENLVTAANAAGVRPMMVLTPLDAEGRFNDNIAAAVFEDPEAQTNLIDNIEANLRAKNMGGVDFDFEYIPRVYAADYVELVARTQTRLSPQGYLTSVALAPKVRADQPGVLYEGHDYAGMGRAADYCLLMTYEWGYTYGEPMAVSPINHVRRVLEYGLMEIPAEKILMGMSNYGYDWALPFVRGESKAEKLTNYQAQARAEYYGVPVEWDENAQAPFYTYATPAGVKHVVWFENERSWQARLALVAEYGLAGISIWNIMHVFYGGL
ncbi:MAG: glycosyl hydrolase family 18 protein [Clostridia bacterium]